jgi:CRP/FNR family transcriptional regulator, cyclic AMP receptor protein
MTVCHCCSLAVVRSQVAGGHRTNAGARSGMATCHLAHRTNIRAARTEGCPLDADRPEGRAWHRLTPTDRAALSAAGYPRTWPSGAIIAPQGGPPGSMLVILHGWVKISITNNRGDSAPVAARGPGEIIGELAPIADIPRSATMEAMNEVHALIIPRDRLRAVIRRSPHIAEELMRAAAIRLQQSDRLRLESGGPNFTQRLASFLVELALQCAPDAEGDARVDLPFMQEELANFARVSRSTLIRGLDDLRNRGAVQTARRRITIVHLHALQKIASGRTLPEP